MGKNIKTDCKKLDSFQPPQKCTFCSTSEVNDDKLGPIYMHKNVITHYFCLLLSSNMEQNGRDHEGILGFLYNDIQKEIKRGQRLFCTYCKHKGATLGCSIRKCRTVFHLPCGLNNDSLHQFFGQFRSYCSVHRPRQEVDKDILAEARKQTAACPICYETIIPHPGRTTLWAPCCKKNAWFHRDCIQRMAINFGCYFFKCPLCNNKDTFQETMKYCGIYIPEQDASWEVVPNAFGDLYERHDSCDAEHCTCPKGRRGNYIGTRWELVLCGTCGSQGIHIGCGRLKWRKPEWHCPTCLGVMQPKSASDRKERRQTQLSEQKKENVYRTRSSVSSTNIRDSESSSEYNSYSSEDEKNTMPYDTEQHHKYRQRKRLYKRSPSPPKLRRYHRADSPSASRSSHNPPVFKNVCTSPARSDSPFRKSLECERAPLPRPCSSPVVRSESHKEFSPLFKKSSAPCTSTIPTIVVDDDDDDDDDIVMIVDDDSPEEIILTRDGSRIKIVPMKQEMKELKSIKAVGDPKIEKIIECNIQLACNSNKGKSVCSDVCAASYTTELSQNKNVLENLQSGGTLGVLEMYKVPVQEYNMSSATFVPHTDTYIVNSDPCGQHGFLQQEVTQQPVWQDVQQKTYINAEQRKLVSSSKRSSVSIDSDICEHRTANSNSLHSNKRRRTTQPAGAAAAAATCNKENAPTQSSSNYSRKQLYVKPRSDNNRLNPYVLLTPLKFTVIDGSVKIYEPKREDEVKPQQSVRKRLKFDSSINSKPCTKLSSKKNTAIHSVKSKVNKVKHEHSTSDISYDFSEPLCHTRKHRISKVKSEVKLMKSQKLKTRKDKTNKIMFNFFGKHKTVVDNKSKRRLTNTINSYLEPRPYELIDDVKQLIGVSNIKNNQIFTLKKVLDAKNDISDSSVYADSDADVENKLETMCDSRPVLFESTNCSHDKFSNVKASKSCRQAMKLNMSSKKKTMKVRKKHIQNGEFGPGNEASKENFSNFKSVIHEVKSEGKLNKHKHKQVMGKPSFKIKLIKKGNVSSKHKKQVNKTHTDDHKHKVPESKQDNNLLQESVDFTKNETTPKQKPSLEQKTYTDSKVNRCLCSYFKVPCTHCSTQKTVNKEEPVVAKKQVKEKLSFTEGTDSSQLKLSFSSNGFCLTRAEHPMINT